MLPELLDLARNTDDHENAWQATAAAVLILFWSDEFTAAADLVAELCARQSEAKSELGDQDFPFEAAFLAEGRYAEGDAAARFTTAAEYMPAGSILRESLTWLVDQLPDRSLDELLPGWVPWGGEPLPVESVIGGHLVDRPYETLTAAEHRVVWQALRAANDFPRARKLLAATDAYPPQYWACTWLAGSYALDGDVPTAERVLLVAHECWQPYKGWDSIPCDLVLQPTLRLAMTERVREHYLTRPIGPERSTTA